jgi:hypothetical protein
MHRNTSQSKSTRIFGVPRFNRLCSAIVVLPLLAIVSASAFAQYPGGGSSPNYGSKGAVIGGVVGGAAASATLLYWKDALLLPSLEIPDRFFQRSCRHCGVTRRRLWQSHTPKTFLLSETTSAGRQRSPRWP